MGPALVSAHDCLMSVPGLGSPLILFARRSCDLLLAALAPDCIRGYPFLISCRFVFFVVDISNSRFPSVPIAV